VIRSKLSRHFGTIACAALLGFVGSVHALPSADQPQAVLEADSSVTGSRQLPGRYEDDDVCSAAAIDRSNCGADDPAGSTVATATDTGSAPESQTYALMLAGLGAAGFLARRRQSL
jgi:MYXO-CTERM domain-containing protein